LKILVQLQLSFICNWFVVVIDIYCSVHWQDVYMSVDVASRNVNSCYSVKRQYEVNGVLAVTV